MNLDQLTGSPVTPCFTCLIAAWISWTFTGRNDTVKVPNGNYRTQQKQFNFHPALEMP